MAEANQSPETFESPAVQPSASAGTFRLAVDAAPADREAALAVLTETLGLNAIDAKTRLRHSPAVWPDEFSKEPALEAAAQLRALGVSAAVVPAESVPDLASARTLHHVRCVAEGLQVASITGEIEQTLPWSRLALLSIADVSSPAREASSRIPNGVFRHAPGIASLDVGGGGHSGEIWLLCMGPFQAFRLHADMMNYEYLKDRRSTSTAENFGQLAADLRARATRLSLTPQAADYFDPSASRLSRTISAAEHRDAVSAYWVLLLGEREGVGSEQHALVAGNSAGQNDVDTCPALLALRADSLYETHALLRREVDELRVRCDSLTGVADSVPSNIVSLVRQLRDTLREHFRLEELNGYMRSVVALDPRFSMLTEKLRQQHAMLLEQLEQLLGTSRLTRDQIEGFLTELESHEHAENALVQNAFDTDLATGD